MTWTLRQSSSDDAVWLAELRAVVMRPDLERLGRFDPVRVRHRLLSRFDHTHSFVIDVDGEPAGMIAVRPEADAVWIEHFYLDPQHQGRGLGGQILQHVIAEHRDERPFRLNVLQGSPARRLYERHGFVLESEDEVDVWLIARF
jgi:GNAT superfamily N-acetyltransferase